jgi:hypothetical protein
MGALREAIKTMKSARFDNVLISVTILCSKNRKARHSPEIITYLASYDHDRWQRLPKTLHGTFSSVVTQRCARPLDSIHQADQVIHRGLISVFLWKNLSLPQKSTLDRERKRD